MRWIATLGLFSAVACATTSSSPPSSAQQASAQSCASQQVAAIVRHDTDVYASPDSTSLIVGTLPTSATICADASASGYGFRHVKLPNGRDGFVASEDVSLL
jgi:hypothetical protein